MIIKKELIFLIIFDFVAVFYGISEVSISYYEAKILYLDNSFLHYILQIFDNNETHLRLFFAIIHIFSIILFYNISLKILKYPKDSLYSTLIFILLPGVYSSAMIINLSGLLILLLLFFIYIYLYYGRRAYLLLPLYLFVDSSFNTLFFALIFYAVSIKDKKLLLLSTILFNISMYIYPLDYMYHTPHGYFLDYFSIYFLIFSPLLFLYFIYALYRIGTKEKTKNIIWYISSSTLLLTLLLTIRQKISLDSLAPFVIIAIPLMVKIFLSTYRIRLKKYRKNHKLGANIVLAVLAINFFVMVFNKSFFIIMDNPKKHFAYNHYTVKELAHILHMLKIKNIYTKDKQLALRLKFYNISSSSKIELSKIKQTKYDKNIQILYYGNIVASYYITKL